jgi:hypothetical protein
MVAPWTGFWERNYFAALWPWLRELMASPYVRGAVTGVGVVTTIVGIRDMAGKFLTGPSGPSGPSGPHT